ncbi:hypothetical protein W03_23660 [Nitrosomonas sp. PY1]|uniref:hypothetical protein n=1 Tax=Nitrosomonas sp. PY1 TaxID=1803906 RepID=UPI001FC85E72|nr:hypothetical protein [Nitrosomonas sp. PY1]GKS70362.1 hypothetical protein W03_23660 [Nitrosomonas sp. PY1]
MTQTVLKTLFSCIAIATFLSACSVTQKNTQSVRTATEQLLITESVLRSLPKDRNMPFPIPRESKVKLDVTGVSADKDIVKGIVAGWLGMHGYIPTDEGASHRINIIVNSLGTEFATTFFGIPPISASFIPISLPELAIYKSDSQLGYSKFYFDIFETASGKFLASSSPFIAESFSNKYTFLFLFTYNKTDIVSPPSIKSVSRLAQ